MGKKRPRDTNQLAKLIVDISTGEAEDIEPKDNKKPSVVKAGRMGGLKGGKAKVFIDNPLFAKISIIQIFRDKYFVVKLIYYFC